jgi:hypothetical protein
MEIYTLVSEDNYMGATLSLNTPVDMQRIWAAEVAPNEEDEDL